MEIVRKNKGMEKKSEKGEKENEWIKSMKWRKLCWPKKIMKESRKGENENNEKKKRNGKMLKKVGN